jgi:uncharacterized protein Yka (UPF0111/DUF47 family)
MQLSNGTTASPPDMQLLRVDQAPMLLGSLGNHIKLAAVQLRDLVAHPIGNAYLIDTIHSLHGETDRYTHDLARRLEGGLVASVDREDVATLTVHVGNVIELIDGSARRIRTFSIRATHPHALELCAVLVRATTQIATAIDNLDRPRRVLLDLASVRDLEDEGDRVYGVAISTLFAADPAPDVIEVMKWKELFDRLADAIEECHRAARVLRRVALSRTEDHRRTRSRH